MGVMVYSLFWVMQDLCHQPFLRLALALTASGVEVQGLGSGALGV